MNKKALQSHCFFAYRRALIIELFAQDSCKITLNFFIFTLSFAFASSFIITLNKGWVVDPAIQVDLGLSKTNVKINSSKEGNAHGQGPGPACEPTWSQSMGQLVDLLMTVPGSKLRDLPHEIIEGGLKNLYQANVVGCR